MKKNIIGREHDYLILLDVITKERTVDISIIALSSSGNEFLLGKLADFYKKKIHDAYVHNLITNTKIETEVLNSGDVKAWLIVEREDQSWHNK